MPRMISTFELREDLANYLNLVARDEVSLVISRFGKPVVTISPFKNTKVSKIKDYLGFMGSGGESGEKYVNRIRRFKAEKLRVEKLRNGQSNY